MSKKDTTNSGWKSKADYRNPDWKYKRSVETDISKTIARVRKEMEALQQQPQRVVELKRAVK